MSGSSAKDGQFFAPDGRTFKYQNPMVARGHAKAAPEVKPLKESGPANANPFPTSFKPPKKGEKIVTEAVIDTSLKSTQKQESKLTNAMGYFSAVNPVKLIGSMFKSDKKSSKNKPKPQYINRRSNSSKPNVPNTQQTEKNKMDETHKKEELIADTQSIEPTVMSMGDCEVQKKKQRPVANVYKENDNWKMVNSRKQKKSPAKSQAPIALVKKEAGSAVELVGTQLIDTQRNMLVMKKDMKPNTASFRIQSAEGIAKQTKMMEKEQKRRNKNAPVHAARYKKGSTTFYEPKEIERPRNVWKRPENLPKPVPLKMTSENLFKKDNINEESNIVLMDKSNSNLCTSPLDHNPGASSMIPTIEEDILSPSTNYHAPGFSMFNDQDQEVMLHENKVEMHNKTLAQNVDAQKREVQNVEIQEVETPKAEVLQPKKRKRTRKRYRSRSRQRDQALGATDGTVVSLQQRGNDVAVVEESTVVVIDNEHKNTVSNAIYRTPEVTQQVDSKDAGRGLISDLFDFLKETVQTKINKNETIAESNTRDHEHARSHLTNDPYIKPTKKSAKPANVEQHIENRKIQPPPKSPKMKSPKRLNSIQNLASPLFTKANDSMDETHCPEERTSIGDSNKAFTSPSNKAFASPSPFQYKKENDANETPLLENTHSPERMVTSCTVPEVTESFQSPAGGDMADMFKAEESIQKSPQFETPKSNVFIKRNESIQTPKPETPLNVLQSPRTESPLSSQETKLMVSPIKQLKAPEIQFDTEIKIGDFEKMETPLKVNSQYKTESPEKAYMKTPPKTPISNGINLQEKEQTPVQMRSHVEHKNETPIKQRTPTPSTPKRYKTDSPIKRMKTPSKTKQNNDFNKPSGNEQNESPYKNKSPQNDKMQIPRAENMEKVFNSPKSPQTSSFKSEMDKEVKCSPKQSPQKVEACNEATSDEFVTPQKVEVYKDMSPCINEMTENIDSLIEKNKELLGECSPYSTTDSQQPVIEKTPSPVKEDDNIIRVPLFGKPQNSMSKRDTRSKANMLASRPAEHILANKWAASHKPSLLQAERRPKAITRQQAMTFGNGIGTQNSFDAPLIVSQTPQNAIGGPQPRFYFSNCSGNSSNSIVQSQDGGEGIDSANHGEGTTSGYSVFTLNTAARENMEPILLNNSSEITEIRDLSVKAMNRGETTLKRSSSPTTINKDTNKFNNQPSSNQIQLASNDTEPSSSSLYDILKNMCFNEHFANDQF